MYQEIEHSSKPLATYENREGRRLAIRIVTDAQPLVLHAVPEIDPDR
jgi:hypothetical protein